MNQSIFDRRRAGLLAPVYSLRHKNDLGIGDTTGVKEAINFCADHGFSVLQLLPILETIDDPSPYSPASSHALAHALLSITPEDVPGITTELLAVEAPPSWIDSLRSGNVDHHIVRSLKRKLLFAAHAEFTSMKNKDERHEELDAFKSENSSWLDPYTAFRVLVVEYDNDTHWRRWKPEHQSYASAVHWFDSHPDAAGFRRQRDAFAFIQWVARRQWKDVKRHAGSRNIRLIGDLTFGISMNSCDTWFHRPLFEMDWSMGTRPLAHFDTSKDSERWGQNWGFPPYRWENHRSTGFRWLHSRVALMRELFHGCRMDHLRGYFRAYMFPWAGGARHVEFSSLDENEAAALTGGLLPRFVPGPDDDPVTSIINEQQGREIISQIIHEAGEMDLVAEIMGSMPEYMTRTIGEFEIATLTFPQLLRTGSGAIIPPEDFRKLALVSYANHDNAPIAMLYLHLKEGAAQDPESKEAKDLKALLDFAGWTSPLPEELDDRLLAALQKTLFNTSANLAVLMISDLLGIPLRFNLPGSYGDTTWNDRLEWPLSDYAAHPRFGPRIAEAARLIRSSGRNAET